MAKHNHNDHNENQEVKPETMDLAMKVFKPAFSCTDLNLPDAETVFSNPDIGESFGGQFERMELEEYKLSPYLQYVRTSTMVLEDIVDGKVEAKTVQIVLARTEDGKIYSHPIGAIFLKNFRDAGLVPGDIFLYKRTQDVKIKKGRGAGKVVPSYEFKVVVRVKL